VSIASKLSDAEPVTLAVCKLSWASPPRSAGCVMPLATCGTCFPVFLASPATTSAYGRRQGYCATPSGPSPATPYCRPTTSGWPTPPAGLRSLAGDRQRSELAGWSAYGYCASHSRWFWELRLHLVGALYGLLVAFALTRANAVDREVLAELGVRLLWPAAMASPNGPAGGCFGRYGS
jgi:hypothetical protein